MKKLIHFRIHIGVEWGKTPTLNVVPSNNKYVT